MLSIPFGSFFQVSGLMQCCAGGQSLAAQEVWNSQHAELTLWVAGESLGCLHSHHTSCRLYLDICSCAVCSVTWVAELRESLELVLQCAWQSSRALMEMMQCSTAQDSSPQWTAHHADAECSSSTVTHPKPLGTKINVHLAAGAVLVIGKLVILPLKPFSWDTVNLHHSCAFLF